jgi:uncharacterized protein YjbI with pentapeptide repeats
LVLFQIQFLPYHDAWITSWQRVAVMTDLTLLWILWLSIVYAKTTRLGCNHFKRVKVLSWLLASALQVLLVWTIATFPGEWVDENLPSLGLVPTTWPPWKSHWASLRELLVAGEVNYVSRRPRSLWSNVLLLQYFEIGDRVKFDTEGRISISSAALSLRGRRLEGAVFPDAHLRNADFTGVQLAGAKFWNADLREAKFGCAPHFGPCAQLQGAEFDGAQLQGANLSVADLEDASLISAHLEGANLRRVNLERATLDYAKLQGASLNEANLRGVSIKWAQLQGADLSDADILVDVAGADLRGAFVKGANLNLDPELGAKLSSTQTMDALEKRDDESLDPAELRILEEVGCAADGAPYVIEGITSQLDRRFADDPPDRPIQPNYATREATVVSAFLDMARCPGARGLSDADKAKLQRKLDRDLARSTPTPPLDEHRASNHQ